MLMAMRDSERKIILLSATITDKIDCFRPFGVVFGFYDNVKKFKLWLRNRMAQKKKSIENLHKSRDRASDKDIALKIIHNEIFPNNGSRLKIKELGNLFPSNQIVAKCYYSDDHEKVNELYNMINKALDDLKDKEKRSSALGEIIRCRMRIEMFKLPIILDLIDDALENNYSVAIFVNYMNSMEYLSHHLKENCSLIHGDQTLDDRQYNIDTFQKNENKVIICIIQAGGVGISLHDLNGRPRMSIISPSWSGTDVVQALGRIHRAGSKSPALQRIVYIAKSYEEEICKKLGKKLSVLSGINDGDLVGPKITKEKLKEMGELEEINKNVVNVDDTIENSNKENDKNVSKLKSLKTVKKKKFVVVQNEDSDSDVDNFIEKPDSKLNVDSVKPFSNLNKKYKLKK
jgi:superfamily II DNA/RNA helicase